jgi:hypothetical protein
MKALKHHSYIMERDVRAPLNKWRIIVVAVLLPVALPTAFAQIAEKSAE